MEPASYWQLPGAPTRYPALESNLEVDAVIIGAGLTGITTAYLLKEASAKVALVERGYCAAVDTGRPTAQRVDGLADPPSSDFGAASA